MKLFLDMDGVLVDFVRGAAVIFGEDYDKLVARWPRGVYDMEEVLGISKTKFYDTLTAAGSDYWANLPPYPYACDFYRLCCNLAPTYILSAPTPDPESLAGKLRWLNKHLGNDFRDYIFTARKEMCARDKHVLIDDHVPNIEKFAEYGGRTILWPTLFNKRHAEASDPVGIVKSELEKMAPGIWW